MMRSPVLVLACGALAAAGAAPARADDDVEVRGLDATDLRGDALVWEDAAFYLEPWEAGAHVRFASSPPRGRRDDPGRAIPVQIVDASQRSFVEIALAPRPGCTWRQLADGPGVEALRLFVKRTELAPVLTRPYVESHADGTGVRLAPGIPVLPTTSGHYLVSLRGDKLRLAIPHASIGYAYAAAARAVDPDPPRAPLVRLDRATTHTVRLGENTMTPRAPWLASKPATAKDPALLRWSTRCAELVVAAAPSALRPADPVLPLASVGDELKDLGAAGPQVIPRGAPLSTPSGREVAVSSAEIAVTPASVSDKAACFDSRLTLRRLDDRGQLARTFRLCAAAELVERRPRGTPAGGKD